MAYGLLSTGFEKKTFDDIRTEVYDELEARFGAPIRRDVSSNIDIPVSILSTKIAECWDALQTINAQRGVTADGVSLDDIVGYSGVVRLAATESRLYVGISGDDTTVIPETVIVRTDAGVQFTVDGSGYTITTSSIEEATIEVTDVVNPFTYTLVLGGETLTVTNSSGSSTPAILAGSFVLVVNTHSTYFSATDNFDGTFTVKTKTPGTPNRAVVVGENLSLNEFYTPIPFKSVLSGRLPAPIGTITNFVVSDTGISKCYNYQEASLGRNRETDAELRSRFIKVRSGVASASLNAIITALQQEVEGVNFVAGYENLTEVTDVLGVPPHHIYIVVDCADTLNTLVAETIFEHKAAGTPMYGAVSVDVADVIGNVHAVKFSKTTNVYAHIRAEITKSSEVAFPSDGDYLIKQAIVSYGNSLVHGSDFLYQALYAPIYGVSGVANVNLEIDATATLPGTPSWKIWNISILPTQKLLFSLDRITLTYA